jgi:hypothetical protein
MVAGLGLIDLRRNYALILSSGQYHHVVLVDTIDLLVVEYMYYV